MMAWPRDVARQVRPCRLRGWRENDGRREDRCRRNRLGEWLRLRSESRFVQHMAGHVLLRDVDLVGGDRGLKGGRHVRQRKGALA